MKACYRVLVLISSTIVLCLADCRFPDYLYKNGGNVTWYMNYPNNKDIKIIVEPKRMYVTECRTHRYRECHTYQRHCSIEKGDGKYLVREVIGSNYNWESTYRCMQFLPRGKSVVQIKLSRYLSESTSSSLCEDKNLLMDNNPLVARELTELEESVCPLIGGYDFKLYRPGESEPLCDDIFLPLRIESDCTLNEGIKMYFRRRNCSNLFVGSPIESDPVRLRCVATWSYLQYTYSIVKWHGSMEYWCVRVTYKRDAVHEVYIYFSGTCPTSNEPYDRMLILKHFKIHYVTNICEDENLVCSYHHCSTHVRDNCKLSCSLCEPEKEERSCFFPREFHGHWNSLQQQSSSALVINNETIFQQHQRWHCVTSTQSEVLRRRKVLKLKFQNGCHPRYMCIELEQPALSMLRYRSGTELHWPIEGLEEVCDDRYFAFSPSDSDIEGISPTSGPWDYYINDSPKYVTCNLPWYIQKAAYYDMYDKYGQHTNSGCLINKNGNPGHMIYLHYTHQDAQKQLKVYLKKTFTCLASIRFIGENDVLITQNVDEGVYMCWSFYRDRERSYVSIYGAKDCGNGTNMQLVHYTTHKVLATLVLHKNSTSCDFIEDDQKVMTRRSDDTLSNLTENNASSSSIIIACRKLLCILFVLVALCWCIL